MSAAFAKEIDGLRADPRIFLQPGQDVPRSASVAASRVFASTPRALPPRPDGPAKGIRREWTVSTLPSRVPRGGLSAPSPAAAPKQPRPIAREDSLMGILHAAALSVIDPPAASAQNDGNRRHMSFLEPSRRAPLTWASPRRLSRGMSAQLDVKPSAAGGAMGAGGAGGGGRSGGAQGGSGGMGVHARAGSSGSSSAVFGGASGGGDDSDAGASSVFETQATRTGGRGGWVAAIDVERYTAYSMPSFHKRALGAALAARLKARGLPYIVTGSDGRCIDISVLALTDLDAAAELAASAAASVTEASLRRGGALSYDEAVSAAADGFTVVGVADDGADEGAVLARPISEGDEALKPPVDDLLAVLPKESLKPIARAYIVFAEACWAVTPFYHHFMHTIEVPVTIVRFLTIPLLNEGAYRRRLVIINAPFSFTMIGLIGQTKIFPVDGLSLSAQLLRGYGGVPFFVIMGIAGLVVAIFLRFILPVAGADDSEKGERRALLGAASPSKSAGASEKSDTHATADGAHGEVHSEWYLKLIDRLAGSKQHPLPTGVTFALLLVLSFVMSLFWLLVIANELVGVVLAFGKVLSIPEIVMGLGFLAVGNSINDFAASIAIARDGYAQMAIAGAYAGPMFNIIAGIGLPMLLASGKAPDSRGAYIGGGTPEEAPIVWLG